jgi:hypothetical protein
MTVTYATNPQATDAVRDAVDVIEGVLEEVLVDVHPAPYVVLDKGSNVPNSRR